MRRPSAATGDEDDEAASVTTTTTKKQRSTADVAKVALFSFLSKSEKLLFDMRSVAKSLRPNTLEAARVEHLGKECTKIVEWQVEIKKIIEANDGEKINSAAEKAKTTISHAAQQLKIAKRLL